MANVGLSECHTKPVASGETESMSLMSLQCSSSSNVKQQNDSPHKQTTPWSKIHLRNQQNGHVEEPNNNSTTELAVQSQPPDDASTSDQKDDEPINVSEPDPEADGPDCDADGETSGQTDDQATKSGEDPWHTAMREMEEQQKLRSKINLIVNNRYKITSKLNVGSYGSIFIADDTQAPPDAPPVAIKFETPIRGSEHLAYEYKVYQVIKDGEGIPEIYWFGNEYDHNILVMDLLGPPLDQLFTFCQCKFSLVTVLKLARQMLTRLRHVHQAGFVHRDIKPENFLVGHASDPSTVYLIDYGLARRYRFRDGPKLQHIPYRKFKNMIYKIEICEEVSPCCCHTDDPDNTAVWAKRQKRQKCSFIGGHSPICVYKLSQRYRSVQKRRPGIDDEQAHQRKKYRNKQQIYNRIRGIKENITPEQLCDGLPPEFVQMLRYARSLDFEAQPKYDYLDSLITQMLTNIGVVDDSLIPFDWQQMCRQSEHDRFNYECTFKWTLPRGVEPCQPSVSLSPFSAMRVGGQSFGSCVNHPTGGPSPPQTNGHFTFNNYWQNNTDNRPRQWPNGYNVGGQYEHR